MVGNPTHVRPDPALDDAEGISCEAAGTNVCLRSRDFDHASWVDSANLTVTDDNTDGPDGVKMAGRLVTSAVTQDLTQNTGSAAIAGDWYTFSCWIKGDVGADVTLQLGDVAGTNTAALISCETGAAGSITADWQRFYVAHKMQAGAANVEVAILMGTGGETIYVDMCQAENNDGLYGASLNATSFIYTAASTVTRAKTGITVPNTELDNKQFTWLAMFCPNYSSAEIHADLGNNRYFSAVGSTLNPYRLSLSRTKVLINYYFGSTQLSAAVSFNKGDWILVGQVMDTVNDKYHYVWNATLAAPGTVAKATPTFNTAFSLGIDRSLSYNCGMTMAHPRIYKGKALTQAEITAEYADMKTKMGLP